MDFSNIDKASKIDVTFKTVAGVDLNVTVWTPTIGDKPGHPLAAIVSFHPVRFLN
jgi:hypothetical protein